MSENQSRVRLVVSCGLCCFTGAAALFALALNPGTTPAAPTNAVTGTLSAPAMVELLPPAPLVLPPIQLPEKRGRIEARWDPVPESYVAGYSLYYGTNQGIYTMVKNLGNVTNFVLTGLNEGTTYYVTVRAYDNLMVFGLPSNEASKTTDVFVSMAMDRWRIQSYGLSGRTNRLQVSTNLTDWRTILTWRGNGTLTNALHTNTGLASFRVIAN